MSRVLWSEAIVPGDEVAVKEYTSEHFGDKVCVEKTRALPVIGRKVPLPEKRVHRSLSRAGVLLSMVCLKARDHLNAFLEKDPFSVGIYCAVENGPVDFASVKAMLDISEDAFAETYKRTSSPKKFFRQPPNLAPAQVGIFLGIIGPIHVYNNSVHGSLHALEQAEMDLLDGRVKAALVCSAFSFENPIIMERIRREFLGQRVLCESSGAMLLVADGTETDWQDADYNNTDEYYGICHQIIIHMNKRRVVDGDRAGAFQSG